MHYKKWTKKFIIISSSILFLICLINYAIDPFRQYNVFKIKPYFENQRYLNAGLVKNFNYNALIVGSSMTENFSINEVNSLLNVNSLKVSFSGATSYENKILMGLAIKERKTETIILGLDFYSFVGKTTRVKDNEDFPFYLYDNNFFNDFKYLLNFDTLYKKTRKTIKANFFGEDNDKLNINKAYMWFDKHKFSQEEMLKHYDNIKENVKLQNLNYSDLKLNFNQNLFGLIKDNQNINFIIFYPPYSILAFKSIEKQNLLNDIVMFKKYIFNQTKKLQNIKIYDFQIEKNVITNLDNYKDLTHYSERINSWMINEIKKENYLLSEKNIDIYLNLFEKQIKEYKPKF